MKLDRCSDPVRSSFWKMSNPIFGMTLLALMVASSMMLVASGFKSDMTLSYGTGGSGGGGGSGGLLVCPPKCPDADIDV